MTTKLVAIRVFDIDMESSFNESELYNTIRLWQEAYQNDVAIILDKATSKAVAINYDSVEPVEISWFEREHAIQRAITSALSVHLEQVTGIANLALDVNLTYACGTTCSAYFSVADVSFVAYLDCESVIFSGIGENE